MCVGRLCWAYRELSRVTTNMSCRPGSREGRQRTTKERETLEPYVSAVCSHTADSFELRCVAVKRVDKLRKEGNTCERYHYESKVLRYLCHWVSLTIPLACYRNSKVALQFLCVCVCDRYHQQFSVFCSNICSSHCCFRYLTDHPQRFTRGE